MNLSMFCILLYKISLFISKMLVYFSTNLSTNFSTNPIEPYDSVFLLFYGKSELVIEYYLYIGVYRKSYFLAKVCSIIKNKLDIYYLPWVNFNAILCTVSTNSVTILCTRGTQISIFPFFLHRFDFRYFNFFTSS